MSKIYSRKLNHTQLFTRCSILVALFFLILGLRGGIGFPDLLTGVRAAVTVQNSVPVTSVSAASFIGSPASLAPNSIVAAFGTQLATGTLAATSQPLPTNLLNTTVTVNGTAAQLFFVSAGQVNYLVPPNTPAGEFQVVITSTQSNGDQVVSRGQVKIAPSIPAIFTANSNGFGAPAAVTGRVNSSGQFVYDPKPPFEVDPLHPGQVIPSPVDPGTNDKPAFFILFGTGLSNAGAGTVRAIIGGVEVPVAPVAAPGFTGLEQINLQIPTSLKGRGNVDLTLVANGVSSNVVTVNIAGDAGAGLSISGFNTTDPALAGQTIAIQGAGFSTTAAQNTVRFGAAQARVVAATTSLLTVIVPFGAESGKVTVQTSQGEARSTAVFMVKTSISGIVQSTGATNSPPAPLENVTVRLVGTNISVRTNRQGSFVLADLPTGVQQLEIDGNTISSDPPYPRVTLKAVVRADRDNQFSQPISLQQISGGSGSVGSAQGFSGPMQISPDNPYMLAALKTRFNGNESNAASQLSSTTKSAVISNRGVSLEIPIGTGIRFPDGKTAGRMQLTVIEKSRLPGITLPVGVFSSAIAQITPLGTTLSPGGTLTFPNPDQNNLGPGAKVDLYRFDFQRSSFIKRGTGTVSPDRATVVSDGRIVDLASFWFAAAPTGVTTVAGRVIDGFGFPVAGAIVSVNGRSSTSDQNGGFNIPDVATAGSPQIQAEAVLPQQFGTPPRGTSSILSAVVGGITNVGTIALSNTNQPGLVLSPFVIDLASNSAPVKVEITLTQPAPAGGLGVTLTSDDTSVATVPATVTIPAGQTTSSFNVTRVAAGVAFIEAHATLSGVAIESFAIVTISKPAPVLTGVTPSSAPPTALIGITGAGFSTIAENNIVGFVRNNNLIAILDPEENQMLIDNFGRLYIGVRVPALDVGLVSIIVAVIDDVSGVISDSSAPISFTVLASNVPTPQLTSVVPAQGAPRDQVTINGTNFSPNAGENSIVFKQGFTESEAAIIRSTATQIVVQIPAADIAKGSASIFARRYASNGATSNSSNSLDFTITQDPPTPVKPTLSSLLNTATQSASGKDGDVVRATGTGFGRNFYDVKTDDLGNADPLITILLFYQGGEIINFALPTDATNGTQLLATVPTGLSQGAAQVTVVTFDLESGLISDESIPVSFQITQGSLIHFDEEEPNDSPDVATDVFLQSVIDGSAAEDDPYYFSLVFNSGGGEILPDLFALSLDAATNVTIKLNFNAPADLDLFVLEEIPGSDGDYRIIYSSFKDTGTEELLTPNLPAGDYLIAVGVYSGSSDYTLTLTKTVPALALTNSEFAPQNAAGRDVVRIEKTEVRTQNTRNKRKTQKN